MTKNKNLIIFITLLLSFFKAILNVVFAFMLKTSLEFFQNGTKSEIIYQILKALIFLTLYLLVELAYNYFESYFITMKISDLKIKSMHSILRSSIINYNRHHSGEFISLLTNDLKSIEDDYYGNIFECISMLFNLLLSVIALIYLNPILGIVSILCSILSLIVPILASHRVSIFRDNFSKQQDLLTRKTKGILDGFETIKVYDVESLVEKDYIKSVLNTEKKNQSLKFLLQSSATLGRLMGYLVFFIIIFTGLFLSIQNKISFGILLASIQLSNNLIAPIVGGFQTILKMRSVKDIREKINNLKIEKDKDIKKINTPINFNKSILVKNVSFSYNIENRILKNINLEIKKGEKYAIVGNSGSGKSTLGKLLMGMCDNYTGEIFIDNNNICLYSSEDIVKLYSLINQNTFLLDDSIEKNVCFYKSIPFSKINTAMKDAQLSEFIDNDSSIGENGILLSGGERQRISLARAFARDKSIIISDEATSQLDNDNMLKIENLILKSNKTVITITHRLVKEVLQKYDNIFVISEGEIVERGTFDQLLDFKGLFYSLFYIAENTMEE